MIKNYVHSLMTDQRNGPISGLIKAVLWVVSIVYGKIVALMRAMYARELFTVFHAGKPVISIGNITMGGSGKTPLVIWISRQLKERCIEPVILTRGYMSKSGEASDEVRMMKHQLADVPIYVGADRVHNIQKALNYEVDIFICDDAFQHWKLKRDLNIVAIDSHNPFGNSHVLPRGTLREPLSALKYADIFILTKTEGAELSLLREKLAQLNPKALIVESTYHNVGFVKIKGDGSKREGVDYIQNQNVVSFCGIADPLSFQRSLSSQGAVVKRNFTFMDHHAYSGGDIGKIVKYCKDNHISVCVTTHKDAVKVERFKDLFDGIEFVYLSLDVEITKGKNELLKKVLDCCRR